jgi:hypothetical protein
MAFKMKAGKEGPMKKNFPSVFKNDPNKVKVFGGRGTVDTSTQAGKNMLKEIKSIPTTSSSEKGFKPKGQITVKHNPQAKYGQTPPSSNKVPKTVIKPGGGQYSTWTTIGKGAKNVAKTIAKTGGKAFLGGIIDPTNKKDPRVTRSLTKPAPKGGA